MNPNSDKTVNLSNLLTQTKTTDDGTTCLERLIELRGWIVELLESNEKYTRKIRQAPLGGQAIRGAMRKEKQKRRWVAALDEAIGKM